LQLLRLRPPGRMIALHAPNATPARKTPGGHACPTRLLRRQGGGGAPAGWCERNPAARMPYSVVQCGYTVPRRGRARPQLFVRAQFGRPTGARRVAGDLGRKQRDPARPRRARSHIPGAAKVAVRAVARVAGAPEHATYATSSSEHRFSSGRKLESSSLLILYGAFAVISF